MSTPGSGASAGLGGVGGLMGSVVNPQYDLGSALNINPRTPNDQKTLVYTPGVRAWVAREGKQYDISADIVGGSILRNENAASTIVLRLANKDLRYNGLFHRMDRITIFLKRVKWVQVFSGYLDSVPLLALRPGVATLKATCTIKRLKHTIWDPGLPESAALLQGSAQRDADIQESEDGLGQADAGLGSLLRRVLVNVGGWDNKNLHIQEIPQSFIDYLTMSLTSLTESNQKQSQKFKELLLGAGDTSGGIGSSAGRSYDTTSGTYSLGQQHYVSEIIAAVDERAMGPTARDVSVGQGIREAGQAGASANATNLSPGGNDAEAWENVATVGTEYEEQSKDSDAAIIAIAVALVESELHMWANPSVPESLNFPNDGIPPGGGDHDSVGLFQQRSEGWGTISQRMNARASAGMFLNALNKYDWRNMDPGTAAARVQKPRADLEYKYGLRVQDAKALVRAARTGQQNGQVAPIPAGVGAVTDTVGNIPGLGGIGNSTQTPSGPGEVAASAAGRPNPDSEGAIQWAMTQLGLPYVWGATGPASYDCSGLTTMAFRAVGLNIGRTTYEQSAQGTSIAPSQVRRGDLVFPHSGHVVMWLGDGTILHAPTSGDVVKIAPVYFDISSAYAIRRYCDNGGPGPASFQPPAMMGPGLPPAPGVGTAAGGSGGTTGGSSEPIARNLFSYMFEHEKFQSKTSLMFTGEKAYINDEPLLQIVQSLSRAGLRCFQSAPNGDLVFYYPDYFGIDGKQFILNLEDIEMKDVHIDFNDDSLTTHVYVAGDHQFGQGVPVNELGWLTTHGVATVENRQLFGALMALAPGFPEAMDGLEIMRTFGVRPLRQEFTSIASKELEFLIAVQLFLQKWAEQYATTVEFTFMPELLPGMRINLSGHNMQVYVTQVSHTFDFENGFSTTAVIMAPSNPNAKNVADRLGVLYKQWAADGLDGLGDAAGQLIESIRNAMPG